MCKYGRDVPISYTIRHNIVKEKINIHIYTYIHPYVCICLLLL